MTPIFLHQAILDKMTNEAYQRGSADGKQQTIKLLGQLLTEKLENYGIDRDYTRLFSIPDIVDALAFEFQLVSFRAGKFEQDFDFYKRIHPTDEAKRLRDQVKKLQKKVQEYDQVIIQEKQAIDEYCAETKRLHRCIEDQDFVILDLQNRLDATSHNGVK